MYISLSGGILTPTRNNDFWGTYGPIIGPITMISQYNEIYIRSQEGEKIKLPMVDGMIYFDSVYYSEMEFIDNDDPILRATLNRERILDFQDTKKYLK